MYYTLHCRPDLHARDMSRTLIICILILNGYKKVTLAAGLDQASAIVIDANLVVLDMNAFKSGLASDYKRKG